MNARLPTESNLRHLKGFAIAYIAAVAASAAVMAVILMGMALFEAPFEGLPNLFSGLFTAFLVSVIGATLFAFPAIMIGYPVAICVARRVSTAQTVISCALVAPFVSTSAQVGFFTLLHGLHPAWISAALILTPSSIAAGATIGWTVSYFERRR